MIRYNQKLPWILDSTQSSLKLRILIQTLFITWHMIHVVAFTTCFHPTTAPCIRRSSNLYATVSKTSSSKSWTGGYVPVHRRDDDLNEDENSSNSEQRSTNDHTGISIIGSQSQYVAAVDDDPATILANLHAAAHHQQPLLHTIPPASLDHGMNPGHVDSHPNPNAEVRQHNIQVVPHETKDREHTLHHVSNAHHINIHNTHVQINTALDHQQHIPIQRENKIKDIQLHTASIPNLDLSQTHVPISTSKQSREESKKPLMSDTDGGPAIGFDTSCVLTEEQIAPIFKFQKKSNGKIKVLNLYSLYTILVCVLTCPLWALSMYLVDMYSRSNPDWDPHGAMFDKTGKIWCKIFLTMIHSYPTMSGDLERLKEKIHTDALSSSSSSSCLFVANHASFLDIAVLCTVLDPVFKFIAKSDLKSFPFIGQQLTGGHHILIDRNDRRSQLRAFKEGVAWLQKGVPLMAFPEGTRSKDGRLSDFKGGMFSMAVKSKVPIVPISISNTHAVFPSNALMPIQMGAGKLHVHVHPPIDVEGKSEEELARLVREALLSKLPFDQHPLEGGFQTSADDDDDEDS